MPNFNYFDDLEDHIDEVLSDLDKMLPKANSELMDLFTELYYSLDKSSTGNIEASVDNLNKINAFRSKIDQTLQDGEYGQAIGDYLNAYKSSSKYLNSYFGAIVNNFQSNDKLYQAILQSNVKTTTNSLLNSGIDANFTDPIIKILNDQVTSGSNKADFMNTLKANLGEENSLLARHVPQIASDAIHQFNANYMNTVASDLGLKYFYFKGTKKKTSRSQCIKMAGYYFTESQLHKVFDEGKALNGGKGWDGIIPGTTWSNYLIYRNGYNCQHYIIPTSKAVYDAASKKWEG